MDWRTQASATITSPIPSAYPGGPSFPAGSRLELSSQVKTPQGAVNFIMPSAVGLFLSISAGASVRAEAIRGTLKETTAPTPAGRARVFLPGDRRALYDYFELCFVATIFAYQAIEAYCNMKMAYLYTKPIEVVRRKERIAMDREELERQLSTGEKVNVILPQLTGLPAPKGKTAWQRFRELEELRNASVHIKSHHQWSSNLQFDDSPYAFFLGNAASTIPRLGMSVIGYFANEQDKGWLSGAEALLQVKGQT
jgi:hypothetical protein